jgi:endonuclease/exonuclease/phosphatase family metal-dependent hydrolase
VSSLRFVTWNLNGLDDHRLDDRTEAAIFTMVLGAPLATVQAAMQAGTYVPTNPPDMLLLQEVTPRMFQAHLSQHLPAGGYSLRPSAAPDRECFEVIAWREPLQVVASTSEALTRSKYSRFLHAFDIRTTSSQPIIRMCTGHLDSGPESAKIREAQLRQINAVIGDQGVFAGDANLRVKEWEATKKLVGMRDGWELLGRPEDTKVTWSRASASPGQAYSARFDRVFVGSQIAIGEMKPIGSNATNGPEGPLVISDHIGLACTVSVAQAGGDQPLPREP